MGRATLGAPRFTPLGIVVAESDLTPARALLDHRQARFARKLLTRPQGGGSGPEIMKRGSSALTNRLRTASLLRAGDRVEEQQIQDVPRADRREEEEGVLRLGR